MIFASPKYVNALPKFDANHQPTIPESQRRFLPYHNDAHQDD